MSEKLWHLNNPRPTITQFQVFRDVGIPWNMFRHRCESKQSKSVANKSHRWNVRGVGCSSEHHLAHQKEFYLRIQLTTWIFHFTLIKNWDSLYLPSSATHAEERNSVKKKYQQNRGIIPGIILLEDEGAGAEIRDLCESASIHKVKQGSMENVTINHVEIPPEVGGFRGSE